MSILRNKLKENFSQIPNSLITDSRISYGARLVAVYLFSKPDGWSVYNKDIQKNLGISKAHTLAKYWKELIEFGWIVRHEKREDGRFSGGYDYELIVNTEMPICGNADNGQSPKMGIHSNTDLSSNTKLKQQEDEALVLYNKLADRASLPKAVKLTEVRRRRIRNRINDCGGIDGWKNVLSIVEGSEFLCGKNNRSWKADLDFILKESSFVKIIERKYGVEKKRDTTRSEFRKVI